MPLHLWPPLAGTHIRKQGNIRNVYNQQEIHTLQRLACRVALEYGLKDLSCST